MNSSPPCLLWILFIPLAQIMTPSYFEYPAYKPFTYVPVIQDSAFPTPTETQAKLLQFQRTAVA